MENDPFVKVQNLTHLFKLSKNTAVKALDNVSFDMRKGEILGIVGESGSGKSTLARCMMNIYCPTSGNIFYDGINTCNKNLFRNNRKKLQTERQIIFQDSNSSLNQRMSIRQILSEPLNINKMITDKGKREEFLKFHLHYVGLEPHYLDLYPSEISGGQRQRVSIARALLMEPQLLIADEPVSSLDVSIQAQIINLFKHLQDEHGFTFLFITHDLSMVEFICNRVGVMYHGKLVELARTEELFKNPIHPYTRSLLSAIPIPNPQLEKGRTTDIYKSINFSDNYEMTEVDYDHFVLIGEEGEL